jgi:hypothetical protein
LIFNHDFSSLPVGVIRLGWRLDLLPHILALLAAKALGMHESLASGNVHSDRNLLRGRLESLLLPLWGALTSSSLGAMGYLSHSLLRQLRRSLWHLLPRRPRSLLHHGLRWSHCLSGGAPFPFPRSHALAASSASGRLLLRPLTHPLLLLLLSHPYLSVDMLLLDLRFVDLHLLVVDKLCQIFELSLLGRTVLILIFE